MSLNVIKLELARDAAHPMGDDSHGYVIRAPLNADGRIDRSQWQQVQQLCSVRRIDKGSLVEIGLLTLNQRGQWVISYALGEDDDEGIFHLDDHCFKPGEYVSITEHDKVQRTFRVRSVDTWHPSPSPAPL